METGELSRTIGGAVVSPGSRRHLRGRRGGLKDLPYMPLDVIYEVSSAMQVTSWTRMKLTNSYVSCHADPLSRHAERFVSPDALYQRFSETVVKPSIGPHLETV